MARKVDPTSLATGTPVSPSPRLARPGPSSRPAASAGLNPETNETPEDLTEQAQWAFEHVRRIVTAAGGTTDDIAHMNIYVKSRDIRPLINEQWVAMFPDERTVPRATPSSTTVRGRYAAADPVHRLRRRVDRC